MFSTGPTSLLLQTIIGQSKTQCTPESWGGEIEPHRSMGGESKNLCPPVTQQPTTPSMSRVYVYTYLSKVKNDGIWDLKGTLKTISFDVLIVQRSKAQRGLTPWNTATNAKASLKPTCFNPRFKKVLIKALRGSSAALTPEKERQCWVFCSSRCARVYSSVQGKRQEITSV